MLGPTSTCAINTAEGKQRLFFFLHTVIFVQFSSLSSNCFCLPFGISSILTRPETAPALSLSADKVSHFHRNPRFHNDVFSHESSILTSLRQHVTRFEDRFKTCNALLQQITSLSCHVCACKQSQ